MKKAILLDIDGCLVDSSQRWLRFNRGEITYQQYRTMFNIDTVIPAGLALYRALYASGNPCIFVTARQEDQRKGTVAQITGILGSCPTLLMRETDLDYEPRTKLRILELAGIKPQDVLFAIDDDEDMVRSYLSAGITVYRAPRY